QARMPACRDSSAWSPGTMTKSYASFRPGVAVLLPCLHDRALKRRLPRLRQIARRWPASGALALPATIIGRVDAPPVQYVRTTDGFRIAYTTFGNGPPLVWMNAIPAAQNTQLIWNLPWIKAALEL